MTEIQDRLQQLAAELNTDLNSDFQLSQTCCSPQHLTIAVDVLKTLNAEAQLVQVYLYFFIIRQSEELQKPLLKQLDPAQQTMLKDLLKIHQSEWLLNPKSRDSEALRRLLLALIRDVRVVLILLTDQLVLMRAASQFEDPIKKQLANSTMTYHAPLANRLGIWQLKWELEDLSFRFLQPKRYKEIAQQLDGKRLDREQFIQACAAELHQQLKKHNIEADIAGRPKHIYSIYRKMQKKNLSFENLFDVRAVRVLVEDIGACYATLGVVHATWKHVPKEFDDYIAQPKGNHYQSLHTVVITEAGKTLEVQIRTHEMHAHAELGVAAHWRYKDGSRQDEAFDEKVNWMRQLINDEAQEADLLGSFQSETQEDRVYVFTPNGDVIDLPSGTTPVDFAYHVHTEIGHRCQGAKINGAIVPLTYILQTGDRVEILTAKHSKPSRDWLREQSGYLHTARARAKVRHWFRENEFDKNLLIGKEILEAELKKYALDKVVLDDLLKDFNLKEVDRLYTRIATGDLSVNQVIRRADLQVNPRNRQIKKATAPKSEYKNQAVNTASDQFLIEGIGSLKTTIASCCQPILGDAVSGFITRTRGISVHRSNCENLHHMINEEPSRLVHVTWGNTDEEWTSAKLMIEAYDQKNLLKELSSILAHNQANIESINTYDHDEPSLCIIELVIQVSDFDHLSSVVERISSMEPMVSVKRTL
ncbi:RelA/SpoT family protein [Marinicella sp. W31]|uniref:RelA/SpoT family protein n=1 Tax=Marinicella sp. W31 TaxID=3023713 RepID=UPI003756AEEE